MAYYLNRNARRYTVAAVVALATFMTQLSMTSSHPMEKADSGRTHQLLETHFGISKRAAGDLLDAARAAPDQCLENLEFQAVINTLIQKEMERLLNCSEDSFGLGLPLPPPMNVPNTRSNSQRLGGHFAGDLSRRGIRSARRHAMENRSSKHSKR